MSKSSQHNNRSEPRQLEGHGSVKLFLPLLLLVQAFVLKFLRQTVKQALNHPPTTDVQRVLSKHNLTGRATKLEDYFQSLCPRVKKELATAQDYMKLAANVEELASSESTSGRYESYAKVAAETIFGVRNRCSLAMREANSLGGYEAAKQVISHVQMTCEESLQYLQDNSDQLTNQQCQSLKDLGESVRSIAQPPNIFWKTILKWWPNLPVRYWAKPADRTVVNQSLSLIENTTKIHHNAAVRNYLIPLLEALLAEPGFFTEMAQQTASSKDLIRELNANSQQTKIKPKGSYEILLVESLDDSISPDGMTFEEVLFQLASLSGCSPKRLAGQFWRDGLKVGDRTLLPSAWHTVPISDLETALKRCVEQYLGLESIHRKLNVSNPKTGADYFGQLTLLSPLLRHRLISIIPDWFRRAKPHLVVSTPNGANSQQRVYLQCASADRNEWEGLFANHARLAKTKPGDADISHGMIAVLTYTIYGLNAHRLPELHSGLHQASLREQAGETALHFENDAGELRLLTQQPDDPASYRQLFDAALTGKVIRPVDKGTARYVLARFEPAIKNLFYRSDLIPVEQTPGFFQRQLASDRFINFVEIHYPRISDWPKAARRLVDSQDSRHAADQLVELDVLERITGGGYRLAGPSPSSLRHAPRGLYRWEYGAMIGLPQDEFVINLRENLRFFSILVFHILDAWMDGRLSQADVPPFVQELRNDLENV